MQKILNHNSDLITRLMARARQLRRLENALMPVLQGELAHHVRLAGYQQGILTLLVDSPAWASQLRFSKPNLLKKLKNSDKFSEIADIIVKVAPIDQSHDSVSHTIRVRSKQAKESLLSTADAVNNDALKDALKRLAQRVGK